MTTIVKQLMDAYTHFTVNDDVLKYIRSLPFPDSDEMKVHRFNMEEAFQAININNGVIGSPYICLAMNEHFGECDHITQFHSDVRENLRGFLLLTSTFGKRYGGGSMGVMENILDLAGYGKKLAQIDLIDTPEHRFFSALVRAVWIEKLFE